jgi:uncharacterized membrane protein
MKEDFWYGLVFGGGMFLLLTVILVVILIQLGAFQRARIARREESQDMELIKKYEALATAHERTEERLVAELSEIRARVVATEELLREVE